MGDARRKGAWIARELLAKFGPNPRVVSPAEAEAYLYNFRQALGRKPFPEGMVGNIWKRLQSLISVDLVDRG